MPYYWIYFEDSRQGIYREADSEDDLLMEFSDRHYVQIEEATEQEYYNYESRGVKW